MFYKKSVHFKAFFFFFTLFLFSTVTFSQSDNPKPDLSVAGIELGNREKARAFLSAFPARRGEDGRPFYHFYNKFGTQVMKVTAHSFEDPYFVTEIEVFAVGRDYTKKHFHAKDYGVFATESGIFIGYRQSAVSMIVGIPNVSREDRIGPKDLVKKKGPPAEHFKNEDREVITYGFKDLEFPGLSQEQAANIPAVYLARFEFNKKKLKKFSIKIIPEKRN